MEKDIILFENAQEQMRLKNALKEKNVVDIATELEEMNEKQSVITFRMIPKDKAAEVFSYLTPAKQKSMIEAMTDTEIEAVISNMFLDDTVDLIDEMPANVVKRILSNVSKEKRELINQFLKYKDGTAGSIMTIEYIALKEQNTVAEAFSIIREAGLNKETVYTCYVTDRERKLKGTVSVMDLLLAQLDEQIGKIMDKSVIMAYTTEDKEKLANDFGKYDLLAMPVVDNEKRLVGIVTIDDAFEVREDEATEDFEIMAAITPSEKSYLKTGVLELSRNRILWLMLLMLSATVTGAIISSFEEALAVVPVLVAFIPMLMDTGGNSGAQSSTLIVRGMALDEIHPSDVLVVLWKEIRVGCLCGAGLVLVNFARVVMTYNDITLAATVSASLFGTVVLAKSIGCLLPLFAKRLNLDPAVMASPVITTIVDAGALIIYFGLAKLMLNI